MRSPHPVLSLMPHSQCKNQPVRAIRLGLSVYALHTRMPFIVTMMRWSICQAVKRTSRSVRLSVALLLNSAVSLYVIEHAHIHTYTDQHSPLKRAHIQASLCMNVYIRGDGREKNTDKTNEDRRKVCVCVRGNEGERGREREERARKTALGVGRIG